MNDYAFLLSCLLNLKKAIVDGLSGVNVNDGICTYVDGMWRAAERSGSDRYVKKVYKLFDAWPECSDCNGYPVPSLIEGTDACTMYFNTFNKWEGEYGAARVRLLDFMIERLQAESADE